MCQASGGLAATKEVALPSENNTPIHSSTLTIRQEKERLWRSVLYYAAKRGVTATTLCNELRLALAVTSPQGKPGRKS